MEQGWRGAWNNSRVSAVGKSPTHTQSAAAGAVAAAASAAIAAAADEAAAASAPSQGPLLSVMNGLME